MRDCDFCENFFEFPKNGSPCGKCLSAKGHQGYKRAGPRTQLKIWLHRLKHFLRGGQ